MRARREANRASDRNESNLGSTFAQTSQLDLSRNALSKYFIASSLLPMLVYTSAIQHDGTYCSVPLVKSLSSSFFDLFDGFLEHAFLQVRAPEPEPCWDEGGV